MFQKDARRSRDHGRIIGTPAHGRDMHLASQLLAQCQESRAKQGVGRDTARKTQASWLPKARMMNDRPHQDLDHRGLYGSTEIPQGRILAILKVWFLLGQIIQNTCFQSTKAVCFIS
jgi:hypothetical protein